LPLHAAPLSGNSLNRLCDHYQVSYAPSVEVLADIRAKAVLQTDGHSLYAVINPEADRRLAFAPIEGIVIAELIADHKVDEGRAGTKEAVVSGARGRAYVHFSCHGSYEWNDPPESGLALADGRLTLADLQSGAVDLSAARVVTLSACETGLTDVTKGSAEEYVGLPAGFLLAGVPCVMCSLWAVPDFSTALLMERFYRNYVKSDMTIEAALHEAQLWVRELSIQNVADYAEQAYQKAPSRNKVELFKYARYYRYLAEQEPTSTPFAHPYYWAAFTVNGA
jgi:CHAT domain-containing protein